MPTYMTQFDYLQALRHAMAGMPDAVIARAVADREENFTDGLLAGRSEAEIAATLPAPDIHAENLRRPASLLSITQSKSDNRSVPGAIRLFFTAIGLLCFNFFMLIPACVYAGLMFALYTCAIVFYAVGIVVASSSLAGVNELVLDGPVRHVVMRKNSSDGEVEDRHGRLRVQIDSGGMLITPESGPHDERISHGTVYVGSGNDGDADSRTVGSFKGIGLILAGILLVLVSMVMTRLTGIAIKRFFQMNLSVLKGG